MTKTTHRSATTARVYWTAAQYQLIAEKMVQIKCEDLHCYSITMLATEAMKEVIDRQYWRDLIMVPDELKRRYVTAFAEYRNNLIPRSVVEAMEPVIDKEKTIASMSNEELRVALGRREDEDRRNLLAALAAAATPTVNIRHEVTTGGPVPAPKKPAMKIIVVGVKNKDQARHIEHPLQHHIASGALVLKCLTTAEAERASGLKAHHVVSFVSMVGHFVEEKSRLWLMPGGRIERRKGINDISNAVLDLLMGKQT